MIKTGLLGYHNIIILTPNYQKPKFVVLLLQMILQIIIVLKTIVSIRLSLRKTIKMKQKEKCIKIIMLQKKVTMKTKLTARKRKYLESILWGQRMNDIFLTK